MPNPSRTLPYVSKIPTSCHQMQPTPARYFNRTESGLEMATQPTRSARRSEKNLTIQMRRWRLMTRRRHHKRPIRPIPVRRVVWELCCNISFTYCFSQAVVPTSMPTQVQSPSSRLLCTNLPQEVTDDVLSVLFQQYVIYGRLLGPLPHYLEDTRVSKRHM